MVLTQFHLTFPHLFWRNLSDWLKGVKEGGSQLASCFYNPSFNPTEIHTFLTYHKNNIEHYRPLTQLEDLQSLKESGF
ncbi:MAG: hypothetical protein C4584_00020 [Armatimonadetes bacterium]|nr:MAG: hypothetical protein C4584_00020 [Armatimonadota bacterium]